MNLVDRILIRPDHREIEPRSKATVQLVLLSSDRNLRHVAFLREVALDLFQKDDNADHVVVVQTPVVLGALDLPHFEYWVRKTGNLFDGFVQHCVTSGNTPPMPSDELSRLRQVHRDMYAAGYDFDLQLSGNELQKKMQLEQIYLQAHIYMLDQLPQLNIKLQIQPLSGSDFAGFMYKNRGILKELLDAEKKYEGQDVDEFLAFYHGAFEQSVEEIAQWLNGQSQPYLKFIDKVVSDSASAPKKSKVLIPMQYIGFLAHKKELLERFGTSKITVNDPISIGCGFYYNSPFEDATARFMRESKAKLTDEELLKIAAEHIFERALRLKPGDWYSERRMGMGHVVERSTPQELRSVIQMYLEPESEDAWLDFPADTPQRVRKLLMQSDFVRESKADRIVGFYTSKTGSKFTFDPYKP